MTNAAATAAATNQRSRAPVEAPEVAGALTEGDYGPRVLSSRLVRICVLTTSFPRDADDPAGRFVADSVDDLRARGVEVVVCGPADFRHFGIAGDHGVVGNLRRAPWKLLLLPLAALSFVRAARRSARDADLVHAHWLFSAIPAACTGRPFVLQVWGTDLEIGARLPWLSRRLLRRARLVLAASSALAEQASRLGARAVRTIASGVAIPADPGDPDEPPHVLFAGRLSPEKGILELVEAARGLPLVVVGDGPLRSRVPEATGFVSHARLEEHYRRAAVVAVPSLREGFGVVAAEASAFGRPVVASRVGGLRDIVVDGETGLHVDPGDVPQLRAALVRLLADADLRRSLGTAARTRARERFSRPAAAALTVAAYEEALRPRTIPSS
jgi:glycosyltransferase involved in cell wall biosynthesis